MEVCGEDFVAAENLRDRVGILAVLQAERQEIIPNTTFIAAGAAARLFGCQKEKERSRLPVPNVAIPLWIGHRLKAKEEKAKSVVFTTDFFDAFQYAYLISEK